MIASAANQHIFELVEIPVILFDLGKLFKSPFSVLRAIRSARAFSPDLIVDFIPWLRFSALLALIVRNRNARSIGFKTPGQPKHFAFDQSVLHRNDQHESQNYMALADLALGSGQNTRVNLSRLSIESPNPYAQASFIVLHPWSGGYRGQDKEWALENYFILDRTLPAEWKILITGTFEDFHRATIFRQNPRFQIVAGSTTLKETAAIISHAKFVVTVNTGILHLSAWLGKNIICLNGPAGPLRWGGLFTDRHQTIINLNAQVPCSPCLNLGFEYGCKKMFCMPTISNEKFAQSIESLVEASLGDEQRTLQYVPQKFPRPNLQAGPPIQDPVQQPNPRR